MEPNASKAIPTSDKACSWTVEDVQISQMARPSRSFIDSFYQQLKTENNLQPNISVQLTESMGIGVFSEKDFKRGETLLREPITVGIQHSLSKTRALVCSHCMKFVGSLEFQIGRRLFHLVEHLVPTGDDESIEINPTAENQFVTNIGIDSSDRANASYPRDEINIENEKSGVLLISDSENPDESADDVSDSNSSHVELEDEQKQLIFGILNESISLPYSECFPLPRLVSCFGNCEEEAFCSTECAKLAWASYHSLLCTGPKSRCKDVECMQAFNHHADETNDIFRLAAKVISTTILKATSAKETRLGLETDLKDQESDTKKKFVSNSEALEIYNAWLPFAMGYRKIWWEFPDSKPESLRQQQRELAQTSLCLLKDAIFDPSYAPLFSLDVYGQIIGLFELNNLSIIVPSPLERYFQFIDELPEKEKAKCQQITAPILELLGPSGFEPCQGTAYYNIQSCFNHSCEPNAKAMKTAQDQNGDAVLIATRDISMGEQIFISYVEENEPQEKRKLELEDYCFQCSCKRCLEKI